MGRQFTAILLLALFIGCAAAPDDAWFRITAVRPGDGTAAVGGDDGTVGASSVASIDVDLEDGASDTVDIVVENMTSIVGSSSSDGVGITVFAARVEYRADGRTLPPAEYSVSLFLPAPGSGLTASATLVGLPVAPVTFKDWILDPANFPPELLSGFLVVETRIILRGRTDEGRNLETEASVSLALR